MNQSKKERDERKVWLAKFEPILKDLRLARGRVGKAGLARWLFNFAYVDLESHSAGEFTDYGFDILSLVIPKDPKLMDSRELFDAASILIFFTPPDKILALYNEKLKPVLDRFPPNTENQETSEAKKAYQEEMKNITAEAAAMPRVPLSLIVRFHDELKKRFEGFFHGHYWKHEEPATVRWLLCPGVRPRDGAWNAESYENPAMQLQPVKQLMLIAGRAVLAERNKFGVCENCKRPFMALKNPLRKHCSEACSQRLRTMRFKESHRQQLTEERR